MIKDKIQEVIGVIGVLIVFAFAVVILGTTISKTNFNKTPHSSYTFKEIKRVYRPSGYITDDPSSPLSVKVVVNKDIDDVNTLILGDKNQADMLTLLNCTSNLEDGMVYTVCNFLTYTGERVEILYIIRPYDNQWVAASITYEDGTSKLFTFFDDYGKTIYDKER